MRTAPSVPPLDRDCRMTVVIPARNEERRLGDALSALRRQYDCARLPTARGSFDVIVFANDCSDATAAVARRYSGADPAVHVIEGMLPAGAAHIGTARRAVMDIAADRFLCARRPRGIIASTDADTIVADDWAAAVFAEMASVDAVAGEVTLTETGQQRLLAPVRLLYARERTYRRLVAEVNALIDPRPEDPLPVHRSFVAANFAVRADTYIAAGRLPALPSLEDRQFARSLRSIDARIRHSAHVRAATSARTRARVNGGFGTFMAELAACARAGRSFLVEHPQTTIEIACVRAELRRRWSRNVEGGADVASPTFGAYYRQECACGVYPQRDGVVVEAAIEALRIAAQRLSHAPAIVPAVAEAERSLA